MAVPRSTDALIEEITARIRYLCSRPFSPEAEAELGKLAQELAAQITAHVQMAKKSLGKTQDVIRQRDPDSGK